MNRVNIFAILLTSSLVAGKDYFTVAVFEHQTKGDNSGFTPRENLETNLKYYTKAAQVAGQKGVDILVFNEFGLIPDPLTRQIVRPYAENVPDPKTRKFNPCIEDDGDRFLLSALSCLAKEHNLYLVANLVDVHPCETECDAQKIDACENKCSEDGVYLYNTDVAFDRKGTLIARYHKRHPYFEELNRPDGPEFITFNTEFGRFGLIVCFDSVFAESYILVKDFGVDHLIFPTYWFDDILLLKGVEWQQSWALANNVNFIAANAQRADTGSLGSGIYSKDFGVVVYTFDNDGFSKLLIGNLRIKKDVEIPNVSSVTIIKENEAFPKTEETGSNFPVQCLEDVVGPAKDRNDYRCFKSQTENMTLTKLQAPSGRVTSCNNGFCCELEYSTTDLQEEFYLASRNGTNNVRNYYFWWEETCLLVRCDPFKNNECVLQPSTSKTIFKNLELRAKFNAARVYPAVVKNKFRLAPTSEWSYINTDSETILKFKSESDQPLLKAVLMGRNYDKDPPFIPWY